MPMMAIDGDDGTFEIGQVIPGICRINANVNEAGVGGRIGAMSFGVAWNDTPCGPGTITVDSADITGLKVVASSR